MGWGNFLAFCRGFGVWGFWMLGTALLFFVCCLLSVVCCLLSVYGSYKFEVNQKSK